MTMVQSLWAFLFAAAVLAMTPGVDTALVLRMSVAGGKARAILAALGVAVGIALALTAITGMPWVSGCSRKHCITA